MVSDFLIQVLQDTSSVYKSRLSNKCSVYRLEFCNLFFYLFITHHCDIQVQKASCYCNIKCWCLLGCLLWIFMRKLAQMLHNLHLCLYSNSFESIASFCVCVLGCYFHTGISLHSIDSLRAFFPSCVIWLAFLIH